MCSDGNGWIPLATMVIGGAAGSLLSNSKKPNIPEPTPPPKSPSVDDAGISEAGREAQKRAMAAARSVGDKGGTIRTTGAGLIDNDQEESPNVAKNKLGA